MAAAHVHPMKRAGVRIWAQHVTRTSLLAVYAARIQHFLLAVVKIQIESRLASIWRKISYGTAKQIEIVPSSLWDRTPRFTVKTDGGNQTAEGATLVVDSGFRTLDSTKVASRAGALAMLLAFWFDGGLFKLATAAVFWILLELGTETGAATKELKKA
jgi:hypothetical protein